MRISADADVTPTTNKAQDSTKPPIRIDPRPPLFFPATGGPILTEV
jgi:hypothetical protein